MNVKKILYATDYSQASQKALQCATWLAKCTQAELIIVHVSEHEQYPVGEHFDEDPTPASEELDRLKAVVPEDAAVRCEHRLLYGKPGSSEITKPAQVILDFARKEGVDMIVVGTHGRTGLQHLIMGSVAESIVRSAHCPVLTTHAPAE